MNIGEDYVNEQKRRRNSCKQEKARDKNDKAPNEGNNEKLLKMHEKELVGNILGKTIKKLICY
jgi:hypothetical protein